ncbi:MAG: DUF4142 domain-containing protein [Proteobacteria bacterium]|nr:MAG: DUF4142 domain-containing protein [Pseudomonadota bacterium]
MNTLKTLACALLVAAGLAAGTANAETRLDDATILAIFDQANWADISTARLGIKRANSKTVKDLAIMVATDHEAVQAMGRALAKKLALIPSPPDDDTSAAAHAEAVGKLQAQSGAAFDAAYLTHEIAFHRAVIAAIRTTLLPQATHPELKALITQVLPGFEHHLSSTESAARSLGVAF